jgi:hypothetical protein
MDDRPFLIPLNVLEGVHNYCNTWCARCRFTARCTAYVNAHPDSPEAKDALPCETVMDPDLMESLEKAGAFREPTPAEMRDWEREDAVREKRATSEPSAKLSRAYMLAAEVAFGEIGDREHPALEVLRHYHFFIKAKVHRAMRGLHDEDFDPGDMESDAYGTAKVALVAMDEMMHAWLALGGFLPATAEIHEAIDRLGQARAALELALPRAREFVRPGFDTPSGAPRPDEERRMP